MKTEHREENDGSTVLIANSVTKTYGHETSQGSTNQGSTTTLTRALNGVSLRIQRGESLAIMGASGSGKTTLLHVLAGIVAPSSGSVVYLPKMSLPVQVDQLNESGRSRLRREEFGFVFQQGLLMPELTALENVALPLMLLGTNRKMAQQRAAEWFTALGLSGKEHHRIGQLSGGQAGRVAIARAQVTGAQLIFADEPTGSLDSSTSAEVMQVLRDSTTGQGKTLVLVTHDPTVAAQCSRVVLMTDGRLTDQENA